MGHFTVGSATKRVERKTISGDTLNQSTFPTFSRINVLNATSLWAQERLYNGTGRNATPKIRLNKQLILKID